MDPSTTVIIANGELNIDRIDLPAEACLIAADGGGQHCLQLGLAPHHVIGDFDSLSAEQLATLQQRGARLHRHPADKDQTDLELALDLALKLGARQVILYGMLGGRWDMSFANLLLLAAPRFVKITVRVISAGTEVYILHGGKTLTITGQPGDLVSVVPVKDRLSGLTYQGLRWPLDNANLPFGTPRGVSNQMNGSEAQISLVEGCGLVFVQTAIFNSNQ